MIIVTSKTTASLELRDSKGVVWSKRHLITNYKKMTISLRTKTTEDKYQSYLQTEEAQGCCFCREFKKECEAIPSSVKRHWKYWALAKNQFPYDAVYQTHDLLFPVRHVDFGDLTVKEVSEYNRIIKELREEYHQVLENFGERQSQKGHYHIHFCKFENN